MARLRALCASPDAFVPGLKAITVDEDTATPLTLPQLPFDIGFPVSKKRKREELHFSTHDPRLPLHRELGRDEWLATSSDPPLFSSDDLPSASADNYLEPRHKRQHQRSWFESEDLRPHIDVVEPTLAARVPRTKSSLRRNFDSGVWVGSDDTEENGDMDQEERKSIDPRISGDTESSEDDDGVLSDSDEVHSLDLSLEDGRNGALMDRALRTCEDPGDFEGPVFPYWQKQPEDLECFHERQRSAQTRVLDCVEAGRETIDLVLLNLQQVRTPILSPLRYFTKWIPEEPDCTSFEPLRPRLRLFLSHNSLDEVPGEIYKLKNLETLSLRCNNLTEIRSSIARLTGLNELNLGSNQLQWLPWEFLRFLSSKPKNSTCLSLCTLHPNPFLRPLPPLPGVRNYIDPFNLSTHVASSPVAFLDITGTSIGNSAPTPVSISEYWPKSNDKALSDFRVTKSLPYLDSSITTPSSEGGCTPESNVPSDPTSPITSISDQRSNLEHFFPPIEEQTNTPSLMELAIRACYKSPQLSQLPFLVADDCPAHLKELLQSTWKLKEAGGQSCSVCGNEYVIPRTEWIEWWYCNPRESFLEIHDEAIDPFDEMPIPFLRRGCSWQCFEVAGPNVYIRGWTTATASETHKEE